ncbi:MAG TPA: cell wall hydrolase [Rhizomicrobium sp.]|nr:cell wall hydrolase [Rhizomicrobium sp.]
MHQKSLDVLRRSDRILTGALAVVLVAASAAVGAAATYRPHTEQIPHAARIAQASAPAAGTAAQAPTPVIPAGLARNAAEELVFNKLLAEHRCLAEAMYYEARGEGTVGQKAIAEVVFHRMRTGNYGQSICAVVYEGANQPGCQFSFTCNGELAEPKQPGPWMRAQVLAAHILTGEERLSDSTEGATNFHAVSVDPDWAAELIRTVQIGNHVFYKNAPRSRNM